MGKRIKDRLIELGRGQKWLGDKCGLSQPAVSKIIRGLTDETTSLPRIADALGVSLNYLLHGTDAPPPAAAVPTKKRRLTTLLDAYDDCTDDERKRFLEIISEDTTLEKKTKHLNSSIG